MEEQRLVMENDLRNLGRMELLQVLLRVTESNEALMAENAELRSASSMQVSRSAKVGSIAEEALRVNGFFEAAQRSADDYLREIMKLRDEMIEHSKAQAASQANKGALDASDEDQLEQSQLFERIQEQAKTYIQDVQTYANNVIARANSQAQGIIDDARTRSDEIISQATDQARIIIEEAESRIALEDAPVVEGLASEGVSEDGPVEREFPPEEIAALAFELEEIDTAASQAEKTEADNSAVEELDVEGPLIEEPASEDPAVEEPVADEPEIMAFATEEQADEAFGEEPSSEEQVASESPEQDAPTAEPRVEDLAAQDPVEGDDSGETPSSDEALAKGPETEDALDEESPGEVSQTTAPLNIDVIVSDIAATAFSEEELDPGSTGALVRRGRHVKLPEGMAM